MVEGSFRFDLEDDEAFWVVPWWALVVLVLVTWHALLEGLLLGERGNSMPAEWWWAADIFLLFPFRKRPSGMGRDGVRWSAMGCDEVRCDQVRPSAKG